MQPRSSLGYALIALVVSTTQVAACGASKQPWPEPAPGQPPAAPQDEIPAEPVVEEFQGRPTAANQLERCNSRLANKKVSVDARDEGVRLLLQGIADSAGVNIVLGPDVSGRISVRLKEVAVAAAMGAIARAAGLRMELEDCVLYFAAL